MEMKYGQIAENPVVNAAIYSYFERIPETEVCKFVKKFREQPHNENQVMHTFRELILGAYLASCGLTVKYDCKIDHKTPDWVIFNDDGSPKAIVELINFHADMGTEVDIRNQLQEPDPASVVATDHGPVPVALYWPPSNNGRLCQRIQEKADKYEKLAKENNLAYVVAVFGEFKAGVKVEEVRQCLFEDHGGLFKGRPTLSGVLFFKESAGTYVFEYIKNPDGAINIAIYR